MSPLTLSPLTPSPLGLTPLTAGDLNLPIRSAVDIRDEGAIAGGIFDCTTAIQRAINATAGVGAVLIPPGTYLVTAPLSMPSGTTLIGYGWASELYFNWSVFATGAAYLYNADQTTGSDTVTNFLVQDLKIRGANDAAHNPNVPGVDGGPFGAGNYPWGILFRRASHCRVQNVWFDRIPFVALGFSGGRHHSAVNCAFTKCGRGGTDLHWYPPGTDGAALFEHVTISGCQFQDMGDDAIAVNSDFTAGAGLHSAIPVQLATTSGSVTVTASVAPTQPFAVGDVVYIPGAGDNNQGLESRIAVVNSTTSIDLEDAAQATIGSAAKAITGATNPANPNPIVITSTAHGFATGTQVVVTGVGGNTAANGTWNIVKIDADHYYLLGPIGNAAYTSGGTATPRSYYGVLRPRHITITGCSFDGFTSSYPGVGNDGVTGVAFGRSIIVRGSEDVTIASCTFRNSTYSSIYIVGEGRLDSGTAAYGSGIPCRNVAISDCEIQRAGEFGTQTSQPRDGIYIAGAVGVSIRGGTIDKSKRYGIYATDVRDLTIDGVAGIKNGGASATNYGIFIDGYNLLSPRYSAYGVTVKGCTVRRNKGGGIRCDRVKHLTLSANVVLDNGNVDTSGANTQSGIVIDGCNVTSVTGNIATDTRASGKTQTYGLFIADTDTRVITLAADNGSGLIRITAAGHGFQTGESITITGVIGTTEANATWTVTVVSSSTFDLQGSTFTHAYTSGGIARLASLTQPVFFAVGNHFYDNKTDPGYVVSAAHTYWLYGNFFSTNNYLNVDRHVSSIVHGFGFSSPEGIVTAPLGSTFQAQVSGVGKIYVKESGVDPTTGADLNTGWVAH